MSQRWALRPQQDPEWLGAEALDEVETVLRAVRPRRDDHDSLTEEPDEPVDLGRIYLC